MVDTKAKPVGSYLLELLAGLAVIVGPLMILSGVFRQDVVTGILGVALTVGGVFVFKRPGRARWPR